MWVENKTYHTIATLCLIVRRSEGIGSRNVISSIEMREVERYTILNHGPTNKTQAQDIDS